MIRLHTIMWGKEALSIMIRTKIIKGAAYALYLYLFIMFLMVLFFNLPGMFVFSIPLQVLCFILGVTVFIGTIYIVHNRLGQSSSFATINERDNIILMSVMLLLFIVQLVFVHQFYMPAGTDAHDIYMSAQGLPIVSSANPLALTYFSTFPNNFFLLFFEHAIYQLNLFIGTGFDFYWVLVVINIIAIDVGLYLVYTISKKIFSRKIACYAFVLGILLLGFSPWLTVVYSDTLSIPFTLLIFYLYLKLKETTHVNMKLCYSLLIGIFVYIAFLIKPAAMFSGIAIVCIEVFMCDYKRLFKNAKKALLVASISIAVFIGMFTVRLPYNYLVEHQQLVPYDASMNMPFTYWMMIGLKETEDGGFTMYGYSAQDFTTTYGIVGKEAKSAHTISTIKQRLKEFGVFGYLHYLWQKSIWILGDGTFYWGRGGVREQVQSSSGISQLMQEFIYPSGKYHKYYVYMLQTIWLIILWTVLFGVFLIKKYAKKEFFIVLCTVFGGILFILLFEGRPRYMMTNLGFYAILGGLGLDTVLNKLQHVWREKEK